MYEIMTASEEADVTVVSSKGQIVIPQSIRKKLGIGPKTKLLIYGYNDAVIMKKLDVPDVLKDLERIYRNVDEKARKLGILSDEDVSDIVQESRRKRRSGRQS
ncbi:AbrB/MazE/SpoVT family DNA-binding domain-containing protein [Nitrososphaera sp.]|uniref:AbrB/MazE/SpoVT family DNA-binding domain-containing protein n=1 Tax=Nitrososphaera sp. TaxID=1971748 RepID=UPI003D6EB65D